MNFLERARNPRKLNYNLWKETRAELERRLRQGKQVDEIRELLKGFSEYTPDRGVASEKTVGALSWETIEAGWLMRGFHGDEVVATIRKIDNHKTVNGEVEVHEVTVLGQNLQERFKDIDKARKAGSDLFEKLRS
ncbi:MAG: hypothetical protein H5U24_16575 [Thioclava marina]|jgi:hypothetical protein|uniref:hypothetical protein n=1 Tax=Thioclava marina TaxID=1915077 RepID=UPI00198C6475|nr:hypothetical protein [Thioclava marina]MBC7146993.1 hypothetical protein [Thioclava marina]